MAIDTAIGKKQKYGEALVKRQKGPSSLLNGHYSSMWDTMKPHADNIYK